jgi:phosphopentomutase
MYGKNIAPVNYGTRDTFADIAATILKLLDVPGETDGNSLL